MIAAWSPIRNAKPEFHRSMEEFAGERCFVRYRSFCRIASGVSILQ